MDLVTRMLNSMSNYDPTLNHFSIIRQQILSTPPIEPDVITSINRACYEYLRDAGARVIPEEDAQQIEIIDALPNAEDMGDRLYYLGVTSEATVAFGIVLWAAAMTASRFHLTPWNHLYDLIREESAGMPEEVEDASSQMEADDTGKP